MENKKAIDCIRLTTTEQNQVLNQLDACRKINIETQRRKWERYTLRQHTVPMRVRYFDESIANYLVCTRNISAGGIGLIHGGYIHSGNACEIVLATLDGEPITVHGITAMCRHVSGRLHEVGMRFVEPIDISLFCERDERDTKCG